MEGECFTYLTMLANVQELLTTPRSNLILFAVILIVVIYGIKNWLSHPSELPPMPCLPIPWLGHTLLMRPSFEKTLMTWSKRMGDVYTVYHGSRQTIVLCSYDLLYEAFVKKADFFSNRPNIAGKHVTKDRTFGLVMNSGPSWREQRSVAAAILKKFGMGKNSLAEKISDEVKSYIKELNDFQEQPQNVLLLTSGAVSNVMCSILLGNRFDYGDAFLLRFLKINSDMIHLIGKSAVLRVFPILRYLPGDCFGIKEYGRITQEMNKMFSDHFIQKFKGELDDLTVDNYIKAYLREMKKRLETGENTYLDESNLRRHIDDLFLAGSGTTSSTILWAFVYAMNFPESQEKVYREIEEVVGMERFPNLHDKPKLNQLNAFILETLRCGSIAPVGVYHTCLATTQLGAYTIPEGVIITPHLEAVLKDERTWKDPEIFRPERFLDEDLNIVVPKEFIPFSMGRRACLGEPLEKMELFLFLSGIFQNFEILPESPASPPSMAPVSGVTVSPQPFKVRFKKRI